MSQAEDEPTLVPNATFEARSIRALTGVVDELTVEGDEAGLLRATLEKCVSAFGLSGAIAFLLEGDTLQPFVQHGEPPRDAASVRELAGVVVDWDRPLVREWPAGGWVAAAALATKKTKLGALALYVASNVEAPDRELLRALGRQIGAGVENLRLYGELRAVAERAEAMNRIGRTLTSSRDLKAGIQEFAREIERLQQFDRLIWAFMNEKGDYLEVVGHPEEASWGLGNVIPLVGSGPGFAVMNDKAVLEHDLVLRQRFIEDSRLLEEGIRSYVLLPLTTRGRAVGVLGLASRRENEYDEATLARMQPLANAVALALENLRLFEKTKELSITDELTPLYNVRFFHQMLEREMKLVDRYGSTLSIIFIDLDRFKPVNDQHGHLRGSRVLREVGFLIRAEVRDTDYPHRYGGDEFVLLLPQTDATAAAALGARLQRAIERHVFLQEEGLEIRIGASVGCATYPAEAPTKDALIRLADERMYKNKDLRKASR
jgi:diguanylate cyclase (GGDEF)-like protein